MSINAEAIIPVMIRRASGSWLAVSPAAAVLKIGVVGETEAEAEERFTTAMVNWANLLSDN